MVDALGLNLAMNFVDDLVVGDPLTFCDFLEGGFSANVFGFGRHS